MRRLICILSDCLFLVVATACAFAIRWGSIASVFERDGVALHLAITFGVGLIVFAASGVTHRVWRYFTLSDLAQLAMVIGIAVAFSALAGFVVDRATDIARSIPLLQGILALLFSATARLFMRMTKSETTFTRSKLPVGETEVRHVLVVGTDNLAEIYLRCVDHLSNGRIRVAGLLTENKRLIGSSMRNVPVVDYPQNIAEQINRLAVHGVFVDEIVVATSFAELTEASREALRDIEKERQIPLEMFEDRLGFANTGNQKAASLAPELSRFVAVPTGYSYAKRMLDILGAMTLIVLTSPLMLLSWLATLIDLGSPVLFWQIRPGYRGRLIRVFKLRTMRAGHDRHGNKIPDENRTTPLGFALRRYRIDELPQLFSILLGDMSFIGPRPLLPIDQPANAEIRLSVRPGLTGWAQVHGGRIINPEDKAALDAWYVKNMSLAVDIKIVIRTIMVILQGETLPETQTLNQARLTAAAMGRQLQRTAG